MLPDIKPTSPISRISLEDLDGPELEVTVQEVAPLVGMNPLFLQRIYGKGTLTRRNIFDILLLDEFQETFIPRSKILEYLSRSKPQPVIFNKSPEGLFVSDVRDFISSIPDSYIDATVTSPPYWGVRMYDQHHVVTWSDGENACYGHEQTPEGYIRHSIEILYLLLSKMKSEGSIWWNVMDTFNSRSPIRSNAAESLAAMRGENVKKWSEHECRRYSSGHSFLKDGDQCLIPQRIAERACRIGYYMKSNIAWNKTGSMPEPVTTRVNRGMEHILHLGVSRTISFNKDACLTADTKIGGRNPQYEQNKITDVWTLSTSNGQGGHGAQFPIALPGRCILLSTNPGDIIFDPFIGSGNTAIAATSLNRRHLGCDVSDQYISIANKRLDH